MMTALYFFSGLACLLGGAHLLVQSSSKLAYRFGIPAIIVGVTFVAFATSAPEVAVSLNAVLGGEAGIALGNVLGSNITNILLILGLSALISPIVIRRRVVWIDVPIMIAASVVTYGLAFDGRLHLLDGIILLILFAIFIALQLWQYYRSRKNQRNNDALKIEKPPSIGIQSLLLVAGLALLVFGSHWLVESAIAIARYWGLSELVIGLTIIAIGTSLPEVATSALAAWQDEADLSVGNVLGSNVFNLLLVLGVCAVFAPNGLIVSDAALALDFPFMIGVSIACLPLFFIGHKMARWEGVVFLGYYTAYLLYLFLDSTQHRFLPLFSNIMALFVLPITLLTITVITYRFWKQEKRNRQSKKSEK